MFEGSKVEQNAPLLQKLRENTVLTMGFMRHMIAKIGPPADRDRFKTSAIWLVTAKSPVRKSMICVSESNASLPLTPFLLAAFINKGGKSIIKIQSDGLYLVKQEDRCKLLLEKYIILETRSRNWCIYSIMATYRSSIATRNDPWRELWGCSVFPH